MTRARLWTVAGIAAVLLLVGLVTGVAMRGHHDPAADAVHADFERVLEALDRYRQDHPAFPDEDDSLAFLVPTYLPTLPQDPWGRPYHFSSDGERAFVASWGKDGLRGGVGPDEDHTQHDGHGTHKDRPGASQKH